MYLTLCNLTSCLFQHKISLPIRIDRFHCILLNLDEHNLRSFLQCFKIYLPLAAKAENGHLATEQHELLVKERDSESRNQFRSDSDNRSHASGLSSHPSQSSSSYSRSRRGSLDRLVYPRQNLSSIGMLGK